MNIKLYIWQRATAAIMAPLVIAHVGVIFYATHKGLSAAEIFGRTRGSILWGLFYGAFVAAAAIHGAIGIRNVLQEWAGVRGSALDMIMWVVGGVLLLLGVRAVYAVVIG
jgi:fumarate reductase subunit C